MGSQLESLSQRLVAAAARVAAVVPEGHPVRNAMATMSVGVPLEATSPEQVAPLVAVWAPVADALEHLADAVEADPSAASLSPGDEFLSSLAARPAP